MPNNLQIILSVSACIHTHQIDYEYVIIKDSNALIKLLLYLSGYMCIDEITYELKTKIVHACIYETYF